MTDDIDLIAGLEERLLRVWPAVDLQRMEGWAVRSAYGYSGRANSASAIVPGAKMTPELLQRVVAYFNSNNLPATVRLSPVADRQAGTEIRQSGFVSRGLAHTMIAPLDLTYSTDPRVRLRPSFDEAWIIGETSRQEGAKRNPDALRAIVSRIQVPACFASIEDQGFGLAAIDRGWLEISSIMIDVAARGQGLGRALVSALLHWGKTQGAGHAFLQVDFTNHVAINLYRSLGFTVLYDYDTLVRPQDHVT